MPPPIDKRRIPAPEPARERMAYIALGSNLGSRPGFGFATEGESQPADPAATVEAAILRLGDLGIVEARSSLYATEPVGNVAQPNFINAVAALKTSLAPLDLLQGLMKIEREFGRDRAITLPKGPRSLDLDILVLGDVVTETAELTLPHPRLAERRFVLAPLTEIAPQLVPPLLHETVANLLAALPDSGQNSISAVSRVGGPSVSIPPASKSQKEKV